jgi:hypothetical protein
MLDVTADGRMIGLGAGGRIHPPIQVEAVKDE